MSEVKKVCLERKKHFVEVHPVEVAGYKKDGWKLVKPAKASDSTNETKEDN